MSAHTWLVILLPFSPLLILLPLWLLDADRPPDNETRQEQGDDEEDGRGDPGPAVLPLAA